MLQAEIDGHLAEQLLVLFERFDNDSDEFITSSELCQLLFSINSDFSVEVCLEALTQSLQKMLPLYSKTEHNLWSKEAFLGLMHTLQHC
jgi:Ca2+-binding EF-hand superfamily protein